MKPRRSHEAAPVAGPVALADAVEEALLLAHLRRLTTFAVGRLVILRCVGGCFVADEAAEVLEAAGVPVTRRGPGLAEFPVAELSNARRRISDSGLAVAVFDRLA